MGLIEWLRRLVGAGPERTAGPKINVEPVAAVRRDPDELTSFISVKPTPEPAVEATVAVSLEPAGTLDGEPADVASTPPETQDPPNQEATLFFQVARAVVGKLVVIKGDLKGEEYELREGENQLGRSPESDVVMPSMWISRSHAVLRCEVSRAEIESTTDKVTSVDGEPVSGSVAVADGAKIQLGGTICRFELEG